MKDKKLTDKEITVKALKSLLELVLVEGCLQRAKTISNALDLINRLQAEKQNLEIELQAMRGAANSYKAENERLRNHIQEGIDLAKQIPEMIAIVKAEAYKECIEKVKEEIAEALKSNYKVRMDRLDKEIDVSEDIIIHYCNGKIDCLRGLDGFLDNLLKELVGDTND